jgi:hypothetical protein
MGWKTKTIFWTAIGLSCAWLVITLILGAAGISRFVSEGFQLEARDIIAILITLALAIQPAIILWLIVRAIRLRDDGSLLRKIARAIYPLLALVLLPVDAKAIQYLRDQSYLAMIQRWHTGSITYLCSTHSQKADYDPKTVGPIELKLKEIRHPGKLATWIVLWPHQEPIRATSFHAHTGSFGGSSGISWHQPDGRHMIAYLSFSDVMGKFGTTSIWLELIQSEKPQSEFVPGTVPSVKYTCGPDLTSYHD